MRQGSGDRSVRFDRALIQRYDGVGPRYTSYPTAVQFRDDFEVADYRRAAASSNGDPIPKPLSVYVHVPFCASPCFYCGCTKVITRDRRKGVEYLGRLHREVEMQAELFDRDRALRQLHLGGGTPTFLSVDQIGEFMDVLEGNFRFDRPEDREFSIEIDPRTIDPENVAELAALGLNRMSLGIQDFDPEVQRAVNRVQSPEMTFALMDAARAAGVRGLSVDLIYGLPLQRQATFRNTLETVLEQRPDRIAMYSYAHLPRLFKPQRQIVESELPSAEEKLGLLELSVQTLTAAGYVYIGMDHFALPDDELAVAQREGSLHRNFQGYSTRAECDLIGLGMSSIGSVGDAYAQNAKNIIEYYNDIDAGKLAVRRGLSLSTDDRLRRSVIGDLMCYAEVDLNAMSEVYGIDVSTYLADSTARLAPLVADGLVEIEGDVIRITPVGRLLMRRVAMCFDAYLVEGAAVVQHSRVV